MRTQDPTSERPLQQAVAVERPDPIPALTTHRHACSQHTACEGFVLTRPQKTPTDGTSTHSRLVVQTVPLQPSRPTQHLKTLW